MAPKDPTLPKKSSSSTKPTKSSSSSLFTGKNIARTGVAIVAIAVALTQNFIRSGATDLGVFLGDIQPYNTAGCEIVPGALEACEDIHLHRASGTAFITCGNAETRKDWFPPVAKLNASAIDAAFQDKFIIYDVPARFLVVAFACGCLVLGGKMYAFGYPLYDKSLPRPMDNSHELFLSHF
jgi:hypothetical protein